MTWLRRIFWTFLLLIVLTTGSYFLFRGVLLNTTIARFQESFEKRFGYHLQIQQAAFIGLASVELNDISLFPDNDDTLLTCNKAIASFSVLRLLKGQPPVDNVIIRGVRLTLHDADSLHNNYQRLLTSKNKTQSATATKKNNGPGSMISSMLNKLFKLADFDFAVRNMELQWKYGAYIEKLHIDRFQLINTALELDAYNKVGDKTQEWQLKGIVDPADNNISVSTNCLGKTAGLLPFITKLTGISIALKNASGEIQQNPSGLLSLKGSLGKLIVNHWRISPEDVTVDSCNMDLLLQTDERSIIIEEGSSAGLNGLHFNLQASYAVDTSKIYALDLRLPPVAAQTFFNSMPGGLFESFTGIQTAGEVDYHLYCRLDAGAPDSVVFESDLNAKDFKIEKFGRENLKMICQSFFYEATENNKVVKVIYLSDENPDFTPITKIAPVLIASVLTAEDGTYFYHRGFNEEAFRKSVATNFKEKRFARGGSTITMQLVKNVFLSRNKSVSRKIEEALIVWMIENYRLCSKERMLEVYLNIIEWGPGIYGITEAAAYYFNKTPDALTLEESIFLSSIIPNPKHFRYTFTREGDLRPSMKYYYQLVAGRLLHKELISQTDYDSLRFNVDITGPAKFLVLPADSLQNDPDLFQDPLLNQ